MPEQRTPFLFKILPYLDIVEKLIFTGLLVGFVLSYLNPDNRIVLKVSLILLAATYFLSAFKIIVIPQKEADPMGSIELLAWLIVPKILWISCAVSLFGFFVYTLKLEHNGYQQALRIGTMSISISLGILLYAHIIGTKYLKYLFPPIIRAIPIVVINLYLLFY